jgi:UDP-2,3-diacylglucosamine hydrolase
MNVKIPNQEILGLIAGGGRFPLLAADAARRRGIRVVAVAHHQETDPALAEKVDEIVWIKVGQLGHLIRELKKKGVKKTIMAGTIAKKKMFENIRPDFKGLTVMSRLAIFHDDDILRAVAEELAKEDIEIVSSTLYLPDLVAPLGCLTRRKPTSTERDDIRLGWKVAKELGRMDIGQCVVVKKKTVLALEAMEGTNETILRGGILGREKAVVVKVSKPNQDLRFDVPAIGIETVRTMSRVKASALAVEARKTLVFDKREMITYANRLGISIVALEQAVDGTHLHQSAEIEPF